MASLSALRIPTVVQGLVAALERKDALTCHHAVRVSGLALRAGVRAALPARQLGALGIGALLHDLGKLATPDAILKSTGVLSADEMGIIRRHPADGEEVIRCRAPELAYAARLVRWHHERFDGGGYPDGLEGEEIPLEVRIISVADAFDAMTNNRRYRRAMPTDRALAILDAHAGTQWDPCCVDLVIEEVVAGRRAAADPPVWSTHAPRDGAAAGVCLDALPDVAQQALLETAPATAPR